MNGPRRSLNSVLQLKPTYEVDGYIGINEAITKLVTYTTVNGKTVPKATVFDAVPDKFVQGPVRPDGTRYHIEWPACIILSTYWFDEHSDIERTDGLAYTSAILRRDGYRCQYCGKPGSTIDHVHPQSRGGENTWWNLVAACFGCNNSKADRTPEEAGMKLLRTPFEPELNRHAREQKWVYRELARRGEEMIA